MYINAISHYIKYIHILDFKIFYCHITISHCPIVLHLLPNSIQ